MGSMVPSGLELGTKNNSETTTADTGSRSKSYHKKGGNG